MLHSNCLLAPQDIPVEGFVVPCSSLPSLPQIFIGSSMSQRDIHEDEIAILSLFTHYRAIFEGIQSYSVAVPCLPGCRCRNSAIVWAISSCFSQSPHS